MTRVAALVQHDRLRYGDAWALQHRLVEERIADRRPDSLLLLEHEPVFTVGRSGQAGHWGGDEALSAAGYPLYHVERGGSVTYHGPGQVVGYPILRLADFCPGPKAYVRLLEETLIRTLAAWGLTGRRVEKFPGVWTDPDPSDPAGPPRKIAALGVRIVRGVTMHGFALNVTVDLAPFDRIVPCGIAGCRVTSMQAELARTGRPAPDITLVRRRVAEEFARTFGLEWMDGTDEQEAGPGERAERNAIGMDT
jgi:lipoate-protein ligase B